MSRRTTNVATWLKNNSFHEFVKDFQDSDVDGSMMLNLAKDSYQNRLTTIQFLAPNVTNRSRICLLSKRVADDMKLFEDSEGSSTDNSSCYETSTQNSVSMCQIASSNDPCSSASVLEIAVSDDIAEVEQDVLNLEKDLEVTSDGTHMDEDVSTMMVQETPQGPIKAVESLKAKRGEQRPLRKDYQIPKKFSPSVMDALKKNILNSREERAFLSEISGSLFSETSYPTSADYQMVVAMIFSEWPFLSKQMNEKRLKMMLQERIKYRRETSGHHKTKTSSEQSSQKPVIEKPIFPQLPSVESEFGDGEDETSHQNNVRYIQTKCSRGQGSEDTVNTLMQRTFQKRRYDVKSGKSNHKALQVAEIYPPLKTAIGLLQELDRIREVRVDAVNKWKLTVPKILKIACAETLTKQIAHHLRKIEELEEEERNIYSIILLYYLLCDSGHAANHSQVIDVMLTTETLRSLEKDSSLSPKLLICLNEQHRHHSTCAIMVDGHILCNCALVEAVPLYVAAFYVFNICYPKGCRNLMFVLENVFFNAPLPEKRVLVKASRIIQELNM